MEFQRNLLFQKLRNLSERRNRSMKTCRFCVFWYLRITQTKLYYKYIPYKTARKKESILIYTTKCYLSFFRPITNRKLKDFLWFDCKNENWMRNSRFFIDTIELSHRNVYLFDVVPGYSWINKYWHIICPDFKLEFLTYNFFSGELFK